MINKETMKIGDRISVKNSKEVWEITELNKINFRLLCLSYGWINYYATFDYIHLGIFERLLGQEKPE